MEKSIRLNVENIRHLLAQPPQGYDAVRFDSNNDCNVHCVYCHNARSKEVISAADFARFLNTCVLSVREFQIGCVMEPTLDPRMCDLMLVVSNSKARPTSSFILQTNGILLHRHDPEKMRDAGLTSVSVSIDAIDATIHKSLRGGTSLSRVKANLKRLRDAFPQVKIVFITTVTRLNIGGIPDLVAFGLDLGVSTFSLREVFYYRESEIVDHSRMPDLVLRKGEFEMMKEAVLAQHGDKARFWFGEESSLRATAMSVSVNSFL